MKNSKENFEQEISPSLFTFSCILFDCILFVVYIANVTFFRSPCFSR